MESLFKVKINWSILLILALFIRLLFPALTWYSYFAIIISLYQIFLLSYSMNHVIPIRYLFGVLMCLQMFIGPVFAFNGLDRFVPSIYAMKISEETYFSYTIPAVICFILGLHIFAGKLKGEHIDEAGIKQLADKHTDLPYIFIAIGFVTGLLAVYSSGGVGSDAVGISGRFGWIFFICYLLGNLKYIGVFILLIGKRKLKVAPAIFVYGSIISSSLGTGLFHDLLIWTIMLGSIISIRFKPSNYLKVLFIIGFISLAFIIQVVKLGYRQTLNAGTENSGISTFTQVLQQNESQNDIFSLQSLSLNNVRINQGFIITNIMKTVPDKVDYSGGDEIMQIFFSAFLPRLLAPDKLESGDLTLFIKYSGIHITKGTSMALSSIGDAYINFGAAGGCVFMFLLGVFYSEILKAFQRYSKFYPILLLFTPLVFYYPIRPDCDLQTILGHIVKSCFLIFLIFIIWKKYFVYSPVKNLK